METIEVVLAIILCLLSALFTMLAMLFNTLKKTPSETTVRHIYQTETYTPVQVEQEQHEFNKEQEQVLDTARAIQHIFLDIEEDGNG